MLNYIGFYWQEWYFEKHIVVRFHLENFSKRQFYIFLSLFKLREN